MRESPIACSGRAAVPALIVVSVLAVVLAQLGGLGTATGGGQQITLAPVATLRLHGSTPCLAWSPDGRRVVVNAAFGGYGEEGLMREHAREVGVHVLEVNRGRHVPIPFPKALHPFWLNHQEVGWVNDSGGDRAGLFRARLGATAAVEKVGRFESAHRAHLGRNGKILARLSSSKESPAWYWVHPRTGQSETAFGRVAPDKRPGSWDTPSAVIADQCPSKVGSVQARADATGIQLQMNDQSYRLAGKAPFVYRGYGPDGHMGPIQPCLSPDGKHLAYLTASDDAHAYSLEVVRVPTANEAQATAPRNLTGQHQLRLHGSTPTMAWSPDSRRLVANAAYGQYGYDDQIARHRPKLGVWVLDAASGKATHVHAGHGYHPFWLSRTTVGWRQPAGGQDAPALFVARASKGARPRQVGKWNGILRALLSNDGKVLAYVGNREHTGWVHVNPDNGAIDPARALAKSGPWADPAGHYRQQCLQAAGSARLQADPRSGWTLQARGRGFALSGPPGDGGAGSDAARAARAVVQACLSPDGRQVAFFTAAGGKSGHDLNVARVPN